MIMVQSIPTNHSISQMDMSKHLMSPQNVALISINIHVPSFHAAEHVLH